MRDPFLFHLQVDARGNGVSQVHLGSRGHCRMAASQRIHLDMVFYNGVIGAWAQAHEKREEQT